MGDASYVQDGFLGGVWSSYYQGRFTDPEYRKALKTGINAIPLEEGAITRRPGTRFIAYTKGGNPAEIWKFGFTSSAPYNLEFTPGFLRLAYGAEMVLQPTAQSVVSFSTPSLWSSATTYAANAVVVDAFNQVYVSIGGSNLNHNPTTDTTNTYWTYAGPLSCLVTVQNSTNWQNGNEVQFFLPPGDVTDFGSVTLLNRQFLISTAGPAAFLIYDSITGAPISASGLSVGPNGLQVAALLAFATPYSVDDLHQLRVVQAIDNEVSQLFIFHPKHQPQVLTAVTNPNPGLSTFASFTLTPATFLDGPYLDPPQSGATLTPTGTSGVITLNITVVAWSGAVTYGVGDVVSYSGIGYISLIDSNTGNTPNVSTLAWQPQSLGADVGPSGFTATDVGRSVRMFSEPALWSSVTAYVTGNVVKFDGSYWTALQNSTNAQPGQDVVNWAVNPVGAAWTWGRIQTVVSSTQVTLQLRGGALLYTVPIVTWQMGRYSNTTGWPANGTYDDNGRLWMVGLQGNHFDGSVSNQTLNFAPTAQDGTVADNNAVAETLNDKEVDAIFWLMLNHGGILMGTQGGEWLLQASALNEPITPTSVQSRKVTKYGQQNVQPEHTPLALMTVQRYGRKLLEYIADPYTGKFSATNVGVKGAQIIQNGKGIAKIAYQAERTPVLWVLLNNGTLAGMTYRRDSPFGTQPATFVAWHGPHTLGSGNRVLSISGGAAASGQTDCLTMVTQNPNTGLCQLEVLTDFFDEDQDITDAWYVDAGDLPALVQLNPSGLNGIRLYGYHYLAGQTVQVWATGIDVGDFTVQADGHIDVPFGSDAQGLFTQARITALSADYQDLFPDLASFVADGSLQAPLIPNLLGFTEFLPIFGTIALPAIDWTNQTFYGIVNGTQAYAKYSIASRNILAGYNGAVIGNQALYSGLVGADGCIYAVTGGSNANPFVKVFPDAYSVPPVAAQTAGNTDNNTFNFEAIYNYIGNFNVLYDYLGVPPPVYGPSDVNGAPYLNGSLVSQSFGSLGVGLTSSQAGIVEPRAATMVTAGDQYYVQAGLVGQYVTTNQAQITVVDGTAMQWIANFTGSLNFANVVAGRQINHGNGIFYGEVFSLQSKVNNSTPTSTPIDLWKLAITTGASGPSFSWTKINSIAPSQVNASWTGFFSTAGIAWDTTDNNILAVASATSGGTGQLYKINSTTGAVMWSLTIADAISVDDILWPQSLIQGGRLLLFTNAGSGGNSTVYWIDTIGGTIISTTSVAALNAFYSQVWGPQGLILYHGNYAYNGGAGQPTPIAPATTAGFSTGIGMFIGAPGAIVGPTALPVIAGYTYTTQVQILRAIAPQESGAQNGPAMAKTRRSHMVGYLFHGAQGVQFGTDFGASLHACNFMLNSTSVTPLPITSLYKDVYWDNLEDDYSFNSQPSFQVTRPYPTTCLAIEGFLHTQDR